MIKSQPIISCPLELDLNTALMCPNTPSMFSNRLTKTFPRRSIDAKTKGLATIIVAGESYGQGSSREHAALCPMYLGVKAIIAKVS